MSLEPGQPYMLVGENDPEAQMSLKKTMQRADAQDEMVFVRNGKEIIEFLDKALSTPKTRHRLPYCIILNLNMPLLNGKQTLQILKDHPEFNGIQVIILSVTKPKFDVVACYKLGAYAFLQNPSDLGNLVHIVTTLREAVLPKPINRPPSID